jgi:hypothetical protein
MFSMIFDLLIGLLIVRTALNNVATFTSIVQIIRHKGKPTTIHKDHSLAVILPVLNETEMIAETIGCIDQIIKEFPNTKVYIVGTARERDAQGLNPTLERANAMHLPSARFETTECTITDGFKAHQLNHAISGICTPPTSTWVLVEDIDSRLSIQGLWQIAQSINEDAPVIQQHAVFLTNVAEAGILQKSQALYQSRWTLTHEMTRVRLRRLTGWWSSHLVGHGLCINLALLRRFGGFPEDTPIEDAHLGYYLCTSNVPFRSLDVLERADCPTSFRDSWQQQYGWSFGPMNYPKYLEAYRRKYPTEWARQWPKAVIALLIGVGGYLRWLFSSVIILTILILVVGHPLTVGVWLCLYLISFSQAAWLFWREGYIRGRLALAAPALMFLHILWASLPPIAALVDTMLARKVAKYKTTHRGIGKTGGTQPK